MEMHRTFNCGIGMVVVVAPGAAMEIMAQLRAAGETVFQIGEITPRNGGDPVILAGL